MVDRLDELTLQRYREKHAGNSIDFCMQVFPILVDLVERLQCQVDTPGTIDILEGKEDTYGGA